MGWHPMTICHPKMGAFFFRFSSWICWFPWWQGWSKCVDYQALYLDRIRPQSSKLWPESDDDTGIWSKNVCKWQVLTQDLLWIPGSNCRKCIMLAMTACFNIYEMLCVIPFATGVKIKLLDVSKCWQTIFVIWGHGSQNVWKKHPSWGKFGT